MNTKDLIFFRRKELFVLLFFLLLIAFSQIALDNQNLRSSRMININPLLVIETTFVENLGLFLPIFTSFFLFFHNRRKDDYSWVPPISWIIIFMLIFIALSLLPTPQNLEKIIPDNTTTTTIIPKTTSTSDNVIPPSTFPTYTVPSSMDNKSPFNKFLQDFRNIFVILILFLPLIVILILQRRVDQISSDDKPNDEEIQKDKLHQFKAKSILECYYQSSDSLEDRGADNSPDLTPTEFKIDVNRKNLTTEDSIEGITGLFEEAKFSHHEITEEKVEKAKQFSYKILSAGWKNQEIEDEES
ncbi:DUF4129 domain-containing protein [Candidatus Hodarchaeum mangrovi]